MGSDCAYDAESAAARRTNKTLTSRVLDANCLCCLGLGLGSGGYRTPSPMLKVFVREAPAIVRLHLGICFPSTRSGLRFGYAGAVNADAV